MGRVCMGIPEGEDGSGFCSNKPHVLHGCEVSMSVDAYVNRGRGKSGLPLYSGSNLNDARSRYLQQLKQQPDTIAQLGHRVVGVYSAYCRH